MHPSLHQYTISRIAWTRLAGVRPRRAGCNARLGEHGADVVQPLARIAIDSGVSGFGWSEITRPEAERLLGLPLAAAFGMRPEQFEAALHMPGGLAGGVVSAYHALEMPLYDLVGNLAGKPVYALLSDVAPSQPLRVPCYDTSIYIDDLAQVDDVAAADMVAAEAADSWASGHRAIKVKVGRGARHMPLMEGTRRDIAIIHAVREAVGPNARLMIDANNGYNFNLAKTVLAETADAHLYWIEEAFHEDAELYRALRAWIANTNLGTLIADGEGDAAPRLLEWAREGLIDVIQYGVCTPSYSRWLGLAPILDAWGVRSAPHNYGNPYGNYAACHLAPAIRRFEMVEWDEAVVDGLDASAYCIADGMVEVPNAPGFGLALDLVSFERRALEQGFVVM